MRNLKLIKKLTLEEKAELCIGGDYWNSKEIERLNVPKMTMSDGPHGLRFQKKVGDKLGLNDSEISTCFPSLATLANSWNEDIMYKFGVALGEEAQEKSVNILLGPSINIKRSPLCGRNFEYISEDPYLIGKMTTEYVKGLQSKGIRSMCKAFCG